MRFHVNPSILLTLCLTMALAESSVVTVTEYVNVVVGVGTTVAKTTTSCFVTSPSNLPACRRRRNFQMEQPVFYDENLEPINPTAILGIEATKAPVMRRPKRSTPETTGKAIVVQFDDPSVDDEKESVAVISSKVDGDDASYMQASKQLPFGLGARQGDTTTYYSINNSCSGTSYTDYNAFTSSCISTIFVSDSTVTTTVTNTVTCTYTFTSGIATHTFTVEGCLPTAFPYSSCSSLPARTLLAIDHHE